MPTVVTYLIQVEFPDYEHEDYEIHRDSVLEQLENSIEDGNLIGSDIESEEFS